MEIIMSVLKLRSVPFDNDELEQSIAGVIGLLAGDIISVQYNANTSGVGGAGTVSISAGSAINIYKI